MLDEAMDGPVHAAGVHHRGGRRGPRGAAHAPGARSSTSSSCTWSRVEAILGARGAAGGRAGCTASATSSATTPGWRPSSTPSSTTTGRACAALDKADVILRGAVAVRQDADDDVPGAAARPVRRQLPARRRGPRDHRPAPAGPRPARPLLRADHHAGAGSAGSARSGGRTRGTPRWSSARYELRRAEAMFDAPPAARSINSSAKSVEEMSTVIIQTLAGQRSRSPTDRP